MEERSTHGGTKTSLGGCNGRTLLESVVLLEAVRIWKIDTR